METSPVWDEKHPLHAEMPTPSNTLSMVGDAVLEAENLGYKATDAVRLVWCQSYLMDAMSELEKAHTALDDVIEHTDSNKYKGVLISFYIFQHKAMKRPEEVPLKYICLHTVLLAGLEWPHETERPKCIIHHQRLNISSPHQVVDEHTQIGQPTKEKDLRETLVISSLTL